MRTTPQLLSRLTERSASVCVVGQGYVGLSVAAGAAATGMTAYGVDRDELRIADLQAGRNVVPGVDDTLFDAAVASGRLHFGTDLAIAAGVDVVLLWWREGDGDLVDALVDSLTNLADSGVVWLLTPKAGRDGHVEPSDIDEAAPTAGLSSTRSTSAAPEWSGTRLVSPPKAVKGKSKR